MKTLIKIFKKNEKYSKKENELKMDEKNEKK